MDFQRIRNENNILLFKQDIFRFQLLQIEQECRDENIQHLVQDFKRILLSDRTDCLEDTYFVWSISIFLKSARTESSPFAVLRNILAPDMFRFLIYKGVVLIEEWLILRRNKNNTTNHTRRLHLFLSAMNELLRTLYDYSKDDTLYTCDTDYLIEVQKELAKMSDLRMLFVLLIRHYEFDDVCPCLSEDLITANHTLLELTDFWQRQGWIPTEFDMVEHVKMYGTANIMQFYGTMLANLEHNTSQVNMCIVTMMHHIAGDCGKTEVLLQLPIIQSFIEADESKHNLTMAMVDLKEYILNTFKRIAKMEPLSLATKLYGNSYSSKRTTNKSDILPDVADAVFSKLHKYHYKMEQMVKRFRTIGIINSLETQEIDSNMDIDEEQSEIIRLCVVALREKHQAENLKWIQSTLCETAYIKLGKGCDRQTCPNPTTLFNIAKGCPVPFVVYSESQEAILHDQHFRILLHYMGFITQQNDDVIFPRIPSHWTPQQLFKKAEKLGPIKNSHYFV